MKTVQIAITQYLRPNGVRDVDKSCTGCDGYGWDADWGGKTRQLTGEVTVSDEAAELVPEMKFSAEILMGGELVYYARAKTADEEDEDMVITVNGPKSKERLEALIERVAKRMMETASA